MEKIKKALEKARRQREQVRRQPASEPRDRFQRAGDGVPASLGITYQQTRAATAGGHSLRESWVIAGLTHETLADTFRILRTRVLQRLTDGDYTALAVTSFTMGDGKTLAAVTLAVGLAKDVNRTVLLVDLDLRRPSVHRYFDLKPKIGLSDCLLGRASLAECLVNSGTEGLMILPGGPPPTPPRRSYRRPA